MDLGIASLAGSAGGALLGGAFNARQASLGRDFAYKMASQGYQIAARDLEKAGLNRILALGNPASGAAGIASMAPPDFGASFTQGSSAQQSIEQSKAQEDVLKQTRENLVQETRKIVNSANLIGAQASREEAEAAKAQVEKAIYTAMAPSLTKFAKQLSEVDLQKFLEDTRRMIGEKFDALTSSPEKLRDNNTFIDFVDDVMHGFEVLKKGFTPLFQPYRDE